MIPNKNTHKERCSFAQYKRVSSVIESTTLLQAVPVQSGRRQLLQRAREPCASVGGSG